MAFTEVNYLNGGGGLPTPYVLLYRGYFNIHFQTYIKNDVFKSFIKNYKYVKLMTYAEYIAYDSDVAHSSTEWFTGNVAFYPDATNSSSYVLFSTTPLDLSTLSLNDSKTAAFVISTLPTGWSILAFEFYN